MTFTVVELIKQSIHYRGWYDYGINFQVILQVFLFLKYFCY